MRKETIILGLLLLVLSFADLILGSVRIPFSVVIDFILGNTIQEKNHLIILQEYRLPKMITAILAGMALSTSGLQMQTLFRNPLAGPFVLGISSGASLGVMLLMFFSENNLIGGFEVALVASLGAGLAMLTVLSLSIRLKNPMALLIAGMMIGSATSGMTNILSYFGTNDQLKSLNIWNFGSLSGVSWAVFPYFLVAILVGLALAFYLTKSYNLLLLGESYAQSMGVNLKTTRFLSMLSTSLLAGSVTAFCGPIGFVGLMTPHIARMLYQTSNHRLLVPLGAFLGSIVLLLCDIIAQLPGSEMALPINAVTALIGAPFVIWLVLSNKKL